MKYVKDIVIVVFSVLFIPGLLYLGYYQMNDARRVINCPAEQVIGELEEKFSIKIPDSALNILAAESPKIDGSTKFILKFQIDPNGFDQMISSFTKGIQFETYRPTKDDRDCDLSPLPDWFLEPIQSGEIGTYGSAYGAFSIVVDQSKMQLYTIYVSGTY